METSVSNVLAGAINIDGEPLIPNTRGAEDTLVAAAGDTLVAAAGDTLVAAAGDTPVAAARDTPVAAARDTLVAAEDTGVSATTDQYWLSIDVGILHLGLVLLRVSPDWQVRRLVWHRLVDITKFKHNQIPYADCKLQHTATITDRMAHVYQEHAHVFDAAERILVELQPITGLQAVQESIFNKYREKVQLVSPNSMHRALGIHQLDYEQRKAATVAIARRYFTSQAAGGCALEDANPCLLESFEAYLDKRDPTISRQHDIADAVCIALSTLDKLRKEHARALRKKRTLALVIDEQGTIDLSRFKRSFQRPLV
jgi:hypothetical protein